MSAQPLPVSSCFMWNFGLRCNLSFAFSGGGDEVEQEEEEEEEDAEDEEEEEDEEAQEGEEEAEGFCAKKRRLT